MSKQQCHYCGSRCEDARGNCGACGAPFEDDDDDYISLEIDSTLGMAIDWGVISEQAIVDRIYRNHGVVIPPPCPPRLEC